MQGMTSAQSNPLSELSGASYAEAAVRSENLLALHLRSRLARESEDDFRFHFRSDIACITALQNLSPQDIETIADCGVPLLSLSLSFFAHGPIPSVSPSQLVSRWGEPTEARDTSSIASLLWYERIAVLSARVEAARSGPSAQAVWALSPQLVRALKSLEWITLIERARSVGCNGDLVSLTATPLQLQTMQLLAGGPRTTLPHRPRAAALLLGSRPPAVEQPQTSRINPFAPGSLR
jgi:hypothetical protein